MQNKQISPINGANNINCNNDAKLLNLNEFGNFRPNINSDINNTNKVNRRTNLNASALLTSSKDFLNSTAPINMN